MVAKAGVWQEKAWKLAPSLAVFMEQADKMAPKRRKRSDGSIASARHFKNNPRSDHDPKAVPGLGGYWVTAIDITHSPKRGMDCGKLFEALRAGKDERIKYAIYNRQIFNSPAFHTAGARVRGPWNPGVYSGYDAHKSHLHLSILLTAEAVRDTANWHALTPQRMPPIAPSEGDLRTVGAQLQEVPPEAATPPPGVAPEVWAALKTWNPKDLLFLRETVRALRTPGAASPDQSTPNSVNYTVRFYREVAKRLGGPGAGARPEEIAAALLKFTHEANGSPKRGSGR